MIKVNLLGTGRKKAAGKAGLKLAMPTNALPFAHVAIVLGTAAGGYFWYSSLSTQLADLDMRIQQAEAQKAALEKVIKEDSIYEARKKTLDTRLKAIEALQRNQVSPVIALDALSEAVNNTEYVWLSSLDQTNTIFSMSGTGTSYDAVAKFLDNLQNGGYFTNIDTPGAQEASPNIYTFTLKCEFKPRNLAPPTPAAAGGN